MNEDMSLIKNYWEKEYSGKHTQFDVEKPDSWIAGLEKEGKITGVVLDAGCGPGRTARYLAEHGHDVLGVDISLNAVERARQRAKEKNNTARFLQADICELTGYNSSFDTVVDIGCFHSLPKNDRGRYAAVLHKMCRSGGTVFIRVFSDANKQSPGFTEKKGLPAIREKDIRNAFRDG